jgi:hypothetical protein
MSNEPIHTVTSVATSDSDVQVTTTVKSYEKIIKAGDLKRALNVLQPGSAISTSPSGDHLEIMAISKFLIFSLRGNYFIGRVAYPSISTEDAGSVQVYVSYRTFRDLINTYGDETLLTLHIENIVSGSATDSSFYLTTDKGDDCNKIGSKVPVVTYFAHIDFALPTVSTAVKEINYDILYKLLTYGVQIYRNAENKNNSVITLIHEKGTLAVEAESNSYAARFKANLPEELPEPFLASLDLKTVKGMVSNTFSEVKLVPLKDQEDTTFALCVDEITSQWKVRTMFSTVNDVVKDSGVGELFGRKRPYSFTLSKEGAEQLEEAINRYAILHPHSSNTVQIHVENKELKVMDPASNESDGFNEIIDLAAHVGVFTMHINVPFMRTLLRLHKSSDADDMKISVDDEVEIAHYEGTFEDNRIAGEIIFSCYAGE